MAELAPEKLIERLASGKAIPAIVLIGSDPYLRDLCRNKVIEAFVPAAARDWALFRVATEGSGWDDILGRAQTLPMLSPRQVIIAEGAETIERLGDDSRDEIIVALSKYLASPAAFTVLLIEASQLDKRTRFYKLLAEQALLVELSIGQESAAALAMQMAKDLGAELDRLAAAHLAEILNNEPARMRIEIEKLAAYAYGRGPITTTDVRALVVSARKNDVWQMAEMLATRQRGAALAFLNNLLREGEEPVAMIGALAWAFRKLIEARDLPATTNGYQASRSLGMQPQKAEVALRNAHRFSKRDLHSALVALAEADSALKSSHPNPRALMEFLIARLTASPAS
ncbi:MAG: DNA polymerase III subunit delta [Candidatus Acidiferrales bacterium]